MPAKKIHRKEAKWGPWQKEELWGARKAAATQRPQARERVSMGGPSGLVQTCRTTSLSKRV